MNPTKEEVAAPAAEAAASYPLTVHEATRRRVPPLGPYLKQLWQRRKFALHLARSELKARHYDTLFGQLWSLLNPLFLAGVYYLVFGVIFGGDRGNPQYLAILLSGLFAFYYTRNSLAFGAKSITGGGGLILNSSFPRAMLPLSAVLSALISYVPMLIVYAAFHLLAGYPAGPSLLYVPVVIAIQTVLNLGLAMGFAALTVYFRDTSSFIPYFLRIWLYVSPIVYTVEQAPESVRPFLALNPLYPLFQTWHAILIDGVVPGAPVFLYAAAWALAVFCLGGWFFLSREREFAVRL